MDNIITIELGRLGLFDVLIDDKSKSVCWDDAKLMSKKKGSGFRLPLDFELEELFKSSLFRGVLKNVSYWSGTETAQKRARSQVYRNGGDFRATWFQDPGSIEPKEALNQFFLIRKSKSKKVRKTLLEEILELALYDAIRERYHINNYAKNGLDRAKVFNEYSRSASAKKSFVAMLKWGGVRAGNLALVNKCQPKTIEKKLAALNELIAKKDASYIIDEYLSNNEIRISGVNLSFITKHLYFVRPGKFLIYDKFMVNLHVAMLLEEEPGQIDKFFNRSIKRLDFSIRQKMNGPAYYDFIHRFKRLLHQVNEELAKRSLKKFTSPGELEAFLFGDSRTKNSANPREMIKKFILNNI